MQSPSDNILDGGPSVLGAILHCLYTLLALAAIVICVGPLWDWLAVWPLGQPDNPLVAVTAIICIYQTVIAQVRYRREVR